VLTRSTIPEAGACARLSACWEAGAPAASTRSGGQLIKANKTTRVNRMIRIPRVLVVDEEGTQLGQMETRDALALAEEKGLDLVEVAPMARPPVCRIMDYGKYRYEQSKKARKARQTAHTVKIKTIKFRPKTDDHDYQFKTIKFRPKTDDHDYQFKKKHIQQFLESGNKVKVIMQFRGREISHLDLGLEFLQVLIQEVSEYGVPESQPQREGKLISFILAPRKTKPAARSEGSEED
jgi:translation initiation factor IF-3